MEGYYGDGFQRIDRSPSPKKSSGFSCIPTRISHTKSEHHRKKSSTSTTLIGGYSSASGQPGSGVTAVSPLGLQQPSLSPMQSTAELAGVGCGSRSTFLSMSSFLQQRQLSPQPQPLATPYAHSQHQPHRKPQARIILAPPPYSPPTVHSITYPSYQQQHQHQLYTGGQQQQQLISAVDPNYPPPTGYYGPSYTTNGLLRNADSLSVYPNASSLGYHRSLSIDSLSMRSESDPPRLAPSGVLEEPCDKVVLRPLVFKPVPRQPAAPHTQPPPPPSLTHRPSFPFVPAGGVGAGFYSNPDDADGRSPSPALPLTPGRRPPSGYEMNGSGGVANSAVMMRTSASSACSLQSAVGRAGTACSTFHPTLGMSHQGHQHHQQQPQQQQQQAMNNQYRRVGSSGRSTGGRTPSPGADSGVQISSALSDLENRIRQREAELVQLRHTMERNEAALTAAFEEKKSEWAREMDLVHQLNSHLEAADAVATERARQAEVAASECRTDLAHRNEEMQQIQSQLRLLQSRLEERETRIDQLENDLREAGIRLDTVTGQLITANTQLTNQSTQDRDGLDHLRDAATEMDPDLATSFSRDGPQSPTSLSSERLDDEHARRAAEFAQERERWLEERARVASFQRQLQLNYVQLASRTRRLEAEVEQLTLELERRELEPGTEGGPPGPVLREESLC